MKKRAYWLLGILVLIYAMLTLLPAPTQETLQRYNLSETSARLLNITIIVPIAGIWFAAFYGYSKLSAYHSLIANSKDGQQIAKLKRGLFWLAASLPVSAIAAQTLELIAIKNPELTNFSIIFKNYISLVLPIVAFLLVSAGARGLVELSKKRSPQLALNATVLLALLLGGIYIYLAARAPGLVTDEYKMSFGQIMMTIVVPYTFIWFLGLYAAYEIYFYSRNVTGALYRESWRLMAGGLMAVIIFSILLQYLGTLSSQLEAMSLQGLLLLIYLLLAFWGASYILVAAGAKRLTKIEEV